MVVYSLMLGMVSYILPFPLLLFSSSPVAMRVWGFSARFRGVVDYSAGWMRCGGFCMGRGGSVCRCVMRVQHGIMCMVYK